jgi:hypothetical protein
MFYLGVMAILDDQKHVLADVLEDSVSVSYDLDRRITSGKRYYIVYDELVDSKLPTSRSMWKVDITQEQYEMLNKLRFSQLSVGGPANLMNQIYANNLGQYTPAYLEAFRLPSVTTWNTSYNKYSN